jgi:hypothetical protein
VRVEVDLAKVDFGDERSQFVACPPEFEVRVLE